MDALTGYLHPLYAESLSEYGKPVMLPDSGGWVIERDIPGGHLLDAMGCYPLFLCRDWSALQTDLETLKHDWISLALVADPFGDHDAGCLQACFPDRMIPFKQHFVVDLSIPASKFVSKHHARNARKALQSVTVTVCADPVIWLDDWIRLYRDLVQRHSIHGITDFSQESFAQQLQVPGLVAFRATADGETVGMILWYRVSDIAYYHLGAYSELGYEQRASFALFSRAIDYFAKRDVGWLNLGAGAGTLQRADDGLSRFKHGWSTGIRTAYFCGRIFDRATYSRLASQAAGDATYYFPAYRISDMKVE